ncbi:MAG: hypothetical protein ABI202_02000 [Candidatus Baltobacteraceae bacterium]
MSQVFLAFGTDSIFAAALLATASAYGLQGTNASATRRILQVHSASHLYVGVAGDGYNQGTGKIEAFDLSARGDAKPEWTLMGSRTLLSR